MRALSSRVIRTALLVVVLFLVIPTGTGSSQERGSLAVERLKRAASGNLDLIWNSRTGTPSAIVGNIALAGLGLAPAASADRTATDVVGQIGDLLGVRRPAEELLATDRTADDLGMTHVTLEQRYRGVEVYNASVKVHFSPDGKTSTGLSSGFVPRIALADVRPRITADQALVQARKALPGGAPLSPTRLVVYPGLGRDDPGAQARLAWLVDLEDMTVPAHNIYVVSATDGAIIDARASLLDVQATGNVSALVQTCPDASDVVSPLTGAARGASPDKDGDWSQGQSFAHWLGQYGGQTYNGYHPGEDWDRGDGTTTSAIYAVGAGKIAKVTDLTSVGLGYLIAVEHTGSFRIPGRTEASNGHTYTYQAETVTKFYSIYLHVVPESDIQDPGTSGTVTCVGKGQKIATISGHLSLSPHLHFEIRHPNQTHDSGWSLVGAASDNNWATFPSGAYNGYLIDVQKMVDAGARQPSGFLAANALVVTPTPRPRKTYDAQHTFVLPGVLKRSGDDTAVDDRDVDNAHNFVGATYDYYKQVHGRDSIDNKGSQIVASAHYGTAWKNAAWNGTQMLFGDGYATRDVTGHELTHGVTENTAKLEYRWQSGALNESFSDIFGVLVNQEVKPNDWLIGEDLPKADLAGRVALRSMSDPGSLGQPANTKDWRTGCDDEGMVHSNSGIFNKAFYNIATDTRVGKDKSAKIFYRALTVYLQPTSSFEDARAFVLRATTDLYPSGTESSAMREDFQKVGLDGTFSPPTNDCSCGVAVSLTAAPEGVTILADLRSVRDTVFRQDPGRRWSDIYYKHQWELAGLLLANGEIRSNAVDGFRAFDPVFRALLTSDSPQSDVILTPELVDAAEKALMGVAEGGSAEMRDDIQREWRQATPRRFVGWRVGDVWKQLQLENSKRIVFPILARG